MSRPAAPSMPTKQQVEEAVARARAVDPAARIKRIGPDGVEFDYPAPEPAMARAGWGGKRSSNGAAA